MESIKKWWKKSMHVSTVLLLIAILGIGLTMAYFTDTETATNLFSTGKAKIDTTENTTGLTKTGIGVSVDQYSVPCYVRIRVDVPLVSYGDGTQLGDQPEIVLVNGTNITALTWNNYGEGASIPAKIQENVIQNGWTKYGEYWYLCRPLEKGENAEIISTLTYKDLLNEVGELPDGIKSSMLTIPITSEAVQKEGIPVSSSGGALAAKEAFNIVEGIKNP